MGGRLGDSDLGRVSTSHHWEAQQCGRTGPHWCISHPWNGCEFGSGGKTELIFDLRGHGAHEAKAQIFRHADPVIPVRSRLLGDIFVRGGHELQTFGYHLHQWWETSGWDPPTIGTGTPQEFRRHRKSIYSNPQLTATHEGFHFSDYGPFELDVWRGGVAGAVEAENNRLLNRGYWVLYNSVALAIWGEQTSQLGGQIEPLHVLDCLIRKSWCELQDFVTCSISASRLTISFGDFSILKMQWLQGVAAWLGMVETTDTKALTLSWSPWWLGNRG